MAGSEGGLKGSHPGNCPGPGAGEGDGSLGSLLGPRKEMRERQKFPGACTVSEGAGS